MRSRWNDISSLATFEFSNDGRNKAKLDQAIDSIRASGGAQVSGVLADASTEEGADAFVRQRREWTSSRPRSARS
jgi:hypothetical protein